MKKLSFFGLVAILAVSIISCSLFITLKSIEITTPPSKTVYTEGETFDKTGMIVTAKYSDDTTKAVTSYTMDKTVLSVGDTKITVSYKEKNITKTADVAITVNSAGNPANAPLTEIKITTNPSKTDYIEGQYFDKTGMVVTANYSDGSSKTVSNYTFKNIDFNYDDTEVIIKYIENGIIKTAAVQILVQKIPANAYYLADLIGLVLTRNSIYDLNLIDLIIRKAALLGEEDLALVYNYGELLELKTILEESILTYEFNINYYSNYSYADFECRNPSTYKNSQGRLELLPAFSQEADLNNYEFKYWINDRTGEKVDYIENLKGDIYLDAVFERKEFITINFYGDSGFIKNLTLNRNAETYENLAQLNSDLDKEGYLFRLYDDETCAREIDVYNLSYYTHVYVKYIECYTITTPKDAGFYISIYYGNNWYSNNNNKTFVFKFEKNAEIGIYCSSSDDSKIIFDGTILSNIYSSSLTLNHDIIITLEYDTSITLTFVDENENILEIFNAPKNVYLNFNFSSFFAKESFDTIFMIGDTEFNYYDYFNEDKVITVKYVKSYNSLKFIFDYSKYNMEGNHSIDVEVFRIERKSTVKDNIEWNSSLKIITEIFDLFYDQDYLYPVSSLDFYLSGDLNLYVRQNSEFTISFKTGGGKEIDDIVCRLSLEINLPAAEKQGYKFLGWSLKEGSEKIYNNYYIAQAGKDITLYAVYAKIEVCLDMDTGYYIQNYYGVNIMFIFKENGEGSCYNSTGYILDFVFYYYQEEGRVLIIYEGGRQDNLYFVDGNLVGYNHEPFEKISESDWIELKIYYSSENRYYIARAGEDLNLSDSYYYYYGKEKIQMPFNFNPNDYPDLTSIELYAYYTDYIDYGMFYITFNLNGGELSDNLIKEIAGNSYYGTFLKLQLNAYIPVKEGYMFIGWFDAPEGGNKYSSFRFNSNNNFTYYAQYIALSEIDYSNEAFLGKWNGYYYSTYTYWLYESELVLNADGTFSLIEYTNGNISGQYAGNFIKKDNLLVFYNIEISTGYYSAFEANIAFVFDNILIFNGDFLSKGRIPSVDYSDKDIIGKYITIEESSGYKQEAVAQVLENGTILINVKYQDTNMIMKGYYRYVDGKIYAFIDNTVYEVQYFDNGIVLTNGSGTMCVIRENTDYSGDAILDSWFTDDLPVKVTINFSKNGVVTIEENGYKTIINYIKLSENQYYMSSSSSIEFYIVYNPETDEVYVFNNKDLTGYALTFTRKF